MIEANSGTGIRTLPECPILRFRETRVLRFPSDERADEPTDNALASLRHRPIAARENSFRTTPWAFKICLVILHYHNYSLHYGPGYPRSMTRRELFALPLAYTRLGGAIRLGFSRKLHTHPFEGSALGSTPHFATILQNLLADGSGDSRI